MRIKYCCCILLIGIIFTVCGCSENSENADKITYELFDNNHQHETENSEEVDHEELDAIEGENAVWPYDLEFGKVENQFIPYTPGNSQQNQKGLSVEYAETICEDTDSHSFFYINYADHQYIYQYSDGVSQLIVDKPALSLQVWKGKLYFVNFIAEDGGGNIYAYDLASKELEVIIDANAKYFNIYEDGIFYFDMTAQYFEEYQQMGYVMKSFFYNIETRETNKCDYPYLYRYTDFDIVADYQTSSIYLKQNETNEQIYLAPFDYAPNYRVYDNYFTLSEHNILYVLNMYEGEKKIYDINDASGLISTDNTVSDYLIYKDKLYVSFNCSNRLIVIDLLTDSMKCYTVSPVANTFFDHLYMANGKLYALCDLINNPKIMQINIDDGIPTYENTIQ